MGTISIINPLLNAPYLMRILLPMIHSTMKLDYNSTHFPNGKNTSLTLSKSVALPILSLFLLITIPLYLYDTSPNSLLKSLASKSNETTPIYQNNLLSIDTYMNDSIANTSARFDSQCNLFKGEWVPYPEGPYYTTETKCVIDDRQNCIKNGRPDTEFLKWRWKPDECELFRFNATNFLEIVRGKILGFLGDSVARNQMESLVCLLASAAQPIDVSFTMDGRFRRWLYVEYNFTIVTFFSPLLVKTKTDPQYNYITKLYLDEADEKWMAQIETVDITIVSAGQWFFRPYMYYEKGELIGCHKCNINNTNEFLPYYGYKMAFRTTFNALLGSKNYKGVTFLRTFSADHFENGDYRSGGNCNRKRPFRKQERELQWYNSEFYRTQVKEFKVAEKIGIKKGLKFKLLDTTDVMFFRPDGHPNTYGGWANKSTPADCVHWCLPGPIDTWNEFLYHMLKMESA